MKFLQPTFVACVLLVCCVPPTVRAADILFMYNPAGNPDFDDALVEFMESLGHDVTLYDTSAVDGDDQITEAASHDLVYVTESLGSTTTHDGVETFIKEVETPQIWAEAYAWDEAAITGDVQFVDFGNTQRAIPEEDPEPEFNEGQTSMYILDPTHPLAGGFSGEVQVYEDLYSLNWGRTETLGSGAQVIASVDQAGEYASLFVYEKGAMLEDDTPAAGMRIGFWLGQAGLGAPIYDNLTENGLTLIEAAINYALGLTPGGPPGDFNGDGQLDATDIDDLTRQAAGGTNPAPYDVNGDTKVDENDVRYWIKDLYKSWVGDADLNREFNSSDLVAVLAAGTYETGVASVWSTGDFNGDALTNSADLVAALADGGYEVGLPPAAVAAVPEPVSGTLLGLGALAALLTLRSRRCA